MLLDVDTNNRNGKDIACKGMRCTDKSVLFEASRTFACSGMPICEPMYTCLPQDHSLTCNDDFNRCSLVMAQN